MKTSAIALLLLLGVSHLQGQSTTIDPPRQLWWVNLGLGLGDAGAATDTYFAAVGSINKPLNRSLLLTARTTLSGQFCIFCSYTENYWDAGVIAGYYSKGKTGFTSIGAGLGLNGRNVTGSGGPENFVAIGVPLESQLFLTLPFAGIGIVGFANLNLKRSFYGAVISLQFGNLK